MTARRFGQIFPLALILCVSITKRAEACCGGRDPESEATRSNEVFRGRVRAYSEAPQNRVLELIPDAVRRTIPPRVRMTMHDELTPKCHVVLDVTRVFKGPRAPTRTIRLDGDCDWLPPPGDEWIVFGTRDGLSVDVDMCTATGPIRDPLDVAFLGPGRPPDPPATRWRLLGILGATLAGAGGLCFWLLRGGNQHEPSY